jgi:hypothetical protein
MTLRDASKAALEMLRIIQAADADHGINDPDLAEVIDALAHALDPKASPAPGVNYRQRPNKFGFSRGQRLLVIGGSLDGEVVQFDAVAGGSSVYALHAGRRVSVETDRLETV